MAEKMKLLIKKRGQLKASLTVFSKYISNLKESVENKSSDGLITNITLIELEKRIEFKKDLLSKFTELQDKIELDNELDDDSKERQEFESSYFSTFSLADIVLIEIRKLLNPPSSEQSQKLPNNSDKTLEVLPTKTSDLQLPVVKLPTFSGSYSTWLEFRDSFISSVEKRTDLDEVEKFQILRSHLDGEAKELVSNLETCSEYYKIAWDMLCERFEKRDMLVRNHLRALLNTPNITCSTSVELRQFVYNISKHLRTLQQLNVDTHNWDIILIYVMVYKFDKKLENDWESYKPEAELPTLEEFKRFINSKADYLEKLETNRSEPKPNISRQNYPNNQNKNNHNFPRSQRQHPKSNREYSSFISTYKISCTFCKGDHYITNCTQFSQLNVSERLERVTHLKLCFNCLRSNHKTKDCRSSNCKTCNAKHHTLLHSEMSNRVIPDPVTTNNPNPSTSNITLNCSVSQSKEILLSTAVVFVSNNKLEPQKCRLLLDNGSQTKFITESFFKKLNLPFSTINISVFGVNQSLSKINKKCTVNLQSCNNNYKSLISCLIIPKICGQLPNQPVSVEHLNIPDNLRLADPCFSDPQEIDMLIGAEHYHSIVNGGQIFLGENLPIMQNSLLGWIISGPISITRFSRNVQCNLSTTDIQQQLAKFWELEEPSIETKPLSDDENYCETLFTETTKRNSDGRFIVHIPLKLDPSVLGNSENVAMRRFYSMERRLHRDSTLKNAYISFMQEYEQLGHMSPISKPDSQNITYFLPHHGVKNEASSTTKLRVVFNGSAQTDKGLSFNDIQIVGPTIQDDLISILLRFRTHKFVVCADIEKMYRQILITPEQRSLQQIFWRQSPSENLSSYQLNTVTYGTASASFLSVRCLKQLSLDNSLKHPKASEVISRDFYVDDFISGADTISELSTLCKDVSTILESGCFNLRKWASNSQQLLNILPQSDRSSNQKQFCDGTSNKLLGLYWSPNNDQLLYNISNSSSNFVTKRSILSEISKIFDPLGLLSPCIITAKILLQKLWLLKLGWDDPVPADTVSTWNIFRESLPALNKLRIPSHVLCDDAVRVELHGFTDSSLNAYGACIFLRSIDSRGRICTSLLIAKSKVAPLKALTVPKLELCAALVLAKLTERVLTSMKLNINSIHFWCDSTTVLCWIRTNPNLLKPFVSNRVSQIQNLTDCNNWQYVNTKENPSDLLTRGVPSTKLLENSLWWNGPQWLRESHSDWPTVLGDFESMDVPELRDQPISLLITVARFDFNFDRFSHLNKLRRTIAYCIRFNLNCFSKKSNRKTEPLTPEELENSLITLLRISQNQSFHSELTAFSNKQPINKKSTILNLNPFMDENGLIRVGGRLRNSDFNYNKKHPISISANHPLTKLLFRDEHLRLFHAGPQLLLSSIRERFWPIRGKNLAKQTVHNCIKCYRANPKSLNPIMGSLPQARVSPQYPFFTTGIDYAGPFFILNKKGRGGKTSKCYLSLFICFSTKAIHLEIVSDLTTQAFLAAFRRFTSRRGKPNQVFSDNGTNFVGADSELRDLANFLKEETSSIYESISNEGVSWHFIPPQSPHFGGLWEAGIKSAKYHLKRVLSHASLTFEELYTVTTQIEGILNSRPLTPLSTDPNDPDVLTPSHFLIGRRLSSLPDPSVQDIALNCLSRFQLLQKLQQDFWSRWSRDYISELQCRSKWKTTQVLLKTGDMVVIRDDKLPPLRWRLGRVVTLHPGSDGIPRVASVKTQTSIVKRGFCRLCVLPLETSISA